MLNKIQLEIISHHTGGLLIMAPVGTGKTLTLAERAVNKGGRNIVVLPVLSACRKPYHAIVSR